MLILNLLYTYKKCDTGSTLTEDAMNAIIRWLRNFYRENGDHVLGIQKEALI